MKPVSYQYVAIDGTVMTDRTTRTLAQLRRDFLGSVTPLYTYDGKRVPGAPKRPRRHPDYATLRFL